MDLENQKLHRSSKRRKKKQKLMIKKGEDKISKLPDALLLHILSFLPIKCVVSTSILCKRWRYLWPYIHTLDLRDWGPCDTVFTLPTLKKLRSRTKKFMNFVDKMLFFHHDDIPNIQKIYLEYDEFFDDSRVDSWFSTLTRRKVEEINLKAFGKFLIPPDCIFTCKSLTTLEIDMSTELFLSDPISLPRLKILHLNHVKLLSENLTQQFFSNCPVLEELSFTNCELNPTKVLSITAPALKILSFTNNFWSDINVVSITAPALEYLSFDGNGNFSCDVIIRAPNLLFLEYTQCLTKNFQLHDGSLSLVGANIGFESLQSALGKRDETGYAESKFIGGLSHVKFLDMSGVTFEALSFVDGLLTKLPKFHNLIHLEVSSMFHCSTFGTLLDFLQILPNLESLGFQGFKQGLSTDDDGWTLNLVPQCLLLHLKSVEFDYFLGHPGELNVVKLFLKNAGILETMTLTSSSKLSQDLKDKVWEQLQTFPIGSPSCEIDFF